MSRIIDISLPLFERLPGWPGGLPPRLTWRKRVEEGSHCNLTVIETSLHAGTHVDAPLHFVPGGAPIDAIPLDTFFGECAVVDLSSVADGVLDEGLAVRYAGVTRLLLRSGHLPGAWGAPYGPHGRLLTAGAARILLDGGLRLLGMDRYSPDAVDGGDYELHRLLLGEGCAILEGLRLDAVEPGTYTLVALPLNLAGREASPVRAVLVRSDADV